MNGVMETERRILCVLSDIDGTLSVPAVRVMISALGRFHKVIFVTYRLWDQEERTRTELRTVFPDLTYLLMMRREWDVGPSDVYAGKIDTPTTFKRRTINYLVSCGYEPIVYFEDDPAVVAWALKEGLPVISCR